MFADILQHSVPSSSPNRERIMSKIAQMRAGARRYLGVDARAEARVDEPPAAPARAGRGDREIAGNEAMSRVPLSSKICRFQEVG